ncbi:MAG: 2-amino-4-hydroxy-6-hydroxymethyldihydropteridine diphosphokinase [Candidatus Eisenbacteria bacterium]|uniref:2-amino-4-hydroxy-6-hydroxymethyldihydropteridine diphosphokinase n=1 Tax=Eiseniibacteriota bacterium TaxID=2212470 RepID=A0A937X836_UNCEI|nr:2-amino-4-hydroxy-6-hydroxymethyldihydropteridine diphosphokinase [Candidatus Eisenbacteria bacterium]
MTRPVALALGSNQGARARALAAARREIARRLGEPVAVSRLYETDPLGGPPGQGRYLNQVVLLESAAPPEALLAAALAVEAGLGRARGERWGPRTIDIDLLLCGGEEREGAALSLPHPRLHERAFVLAPLAEVLPEWRHPRLGRTARDLLAACDRRGVRVWNGGRSPGGDGAGQRE